MNDRVRILRDALRRPDLIVMPCCYDALSARLVEQAGYPLTFMSGFSVAAARLGLPDTGLISYGEMADQGRDICAAVSIPVIGDGDTGYGNAVNVKRTVHGFATAGFAGVMIEDQEWPKRCGHTDGTRVVDRDEALARIAAACDARDEGADVVIVARTDARATEGLDEALWRANAFAEIGADVIFVEAPRSTEELARIGQEVAGVKMANMVASGATPAVPTERLQRMGFKLAAYPLTLISAAAGAMQTALADLRNGQEPAGAVGFDDLQALAGFPAYKEQATRYTQPIVTAARRGVATLAAHRSSAAARHSSTHGRSNVASLGRWVVGAMVTLVGLFALYLASRADDPVMYGTGIFFFVASVLFNFLLIRQAFDKGGHA